ncbi:hypothetical protein GCM10009110_08450 [Psychrobacter piscatorii]
MYQHCSSLAPNHIIIDNRRLKIKSKYQTTILTLKILSEISIKTVNAFVVVAHQSMHSN